MDRLYENINGVDCCSHKTIALHAAQDFLPEIASAENPQGLTWGRLLGSSCLVRESEQREDGH